MIGVDNSGLAEKISKLVPDNTLPMMTSQGPFGSVEMDGMFTVMKVRRSQKRGDYSDPGWYRQPPGTQAREVTDGVAEALRAPQAASPRGAPGDMELIVRKPTGHAGHWMKGQGMNASLLLAA